MTKVKLDKIQHWSEVKLSILREYSAAYATVIAGQKAYTFETHYIDAFSGAGQHILKQTGEIIPGSPLNALNVKPGFNKYHFIDLNPKKVKLLKTLTERYHNVEVYHGNCNQLLLTQVFPKIRYDNYQRALCFLDPYGMHLNWDILLAAGQSKSIEFFLNFPIHDMNRNALLHDKGKADPADIQRMTDFWGDESWLKAAYSTHNLFGLDEKTSNEEILKAFVKRLNELAGYEYIPSPIPMRNNKRAVIYYLIFASHNKTAARIANDIFKKYREEA